MTTIKFLIIIIFLIITLSDGKSEEILNWQDCVKIARENHPDLISAKEKVSQAKTNAGITRSVMLPQIDTNATAATSKNNYSGRASSLSGKTESYSYGITGKQLLFDSAKSAYDLKSAQKQIESSDFDLQITSTNVRLSLRNSFIQLLRAQESMSIAKDIVKIRKQNFDLVEMRYKAGVENKGSLLQAEANLAQAEFELSQAERQVSLGQHSLIKGMGLSEFKPIKISGDIKSVKPQNEKPDTASLAVINPALQKIRKQKESAEYKIKAADLDNSPKLYGQLSAEKTGSKWPPENSELTASVQLSFNLFQGGKYYYQSSNARAVYRQLTADERSVRDSIMISLEQKWTEFRNYTDIANVQSKFLKAAEERAVIADAQYAIGSLVFNNWIIIQDALVSAKKSYLEALASAQFAEAEWIQAKGGTLDYTE